MRKQTIYVSEPLKNFRIAKKRPKGSVELKEFETRSVRAFKKGGRRYVVGKEGFKLKNDWGSRK